MRQTVRHQWSDYETSDPMGDLQQAKDYIYRSTGRQPVAMTLRVETRAWLVQHPDVLDRMKYLPAGADRSRTITIESKAQIVASMTYLEDSLPKADQLELIVGLVIQVPMLHHDSLLLRDASRSPLAVVYNDAMAVEICENE